jgi:hypothetical protein
VWVAMWHIIDQEKRETDYVSDCLIDLVLIPGV